MRVSGIVVCGCGYWGSNIIRNMAALSALYGVADTDMAAAQRAGQAHGARALGFEEAIADSQVSGIMIATPAPTHVELARRALMAGKHVFVEKPLALSVAEARMLEALAKQQGKVLMVGHLLQFHPAYLALKQAIADGLIGTPWHIHSNRLSFGRLQREEGVLWSFAPHDFSMILGITGEEPKSIRAHACSVLSGGGTDIVTVEMGFSHVQATVMVSWLHPVKEHKLTVLGSGGVLVFDDGQPWETKLMHYAHRVDEAQGLPLAVKGEAKALPVTPAEPLREECAHFLSCIEHGASPVTDAEEGVRVVKALSLAAQAMGREQPAHAPYFVHDTAVVDEDVEIGEGSKIWHFSHILPGSRIGRRVVVGQNVSIGPKVAVGDGCKIQNNVSLYEGVTLEDDVFCGPSCVFTNVKTPRAHVNRRGEFLPTHVGRGASIGANATIICGNRIGAYAMVGAGAVVTKAVKAHALVVGNPARQAGWVSHSGEVLPESLICPREGRRYRVTAQGELEEMPEARAHG